MGARLYARVEAHDCREEPAEAQPDRQDLWGWLAAKRPLEGCGGRFVAVMESVAYFSATRKNRIRIDQALTEQYKTAYSNHDALLGDFPELGNNFLDVHGVSAPDAYIYIDADYAGPNGYAFIAAAIGVFLHR